VYGLTKGQFSATADVGSKLKSGVANELAPIDLCSMAIQLGATFVARSFSGDKRQLSAVLKAAIAHRGTALLDVVSPCVTFNDHEGSTKSFGYVKEHAEALDEVSFVPAHEDIQVEYAPGTSVEVTMHDGSRLRLSKLEEGYDPRDPVGAVTRLVRARAAGEVLTGVLYLNTGSQSLLERLALVDAPLATLPEAQVRPPKAVLDALMDELR
jgi:2-oxoglutarate/2-oxoacid ferredoxin oxidoreductase subunit beta